MYKHFYYIFQVVDPVVVVVVAVVVVVKIFSQEKISHFLQFRIKNTIFSSEYLLFA